MDKKWPFGFFVYSSIGDNEDKSQTEDAVAEETVASVEPAVETKVEGTVEEVEVIWSESPATVIAGEDESQTEEEASVEEAIADDFDDDINAEEDEDLPDLEEELEIALDTAHEEEVKKHRLIKGITAGVAVLGAVGLATGLSIRAYLKKK